jgi:hypothetical protein
MNVNWKTDEEVDLRKVKIIQQQARELSQSLCSNPMYFLVAGIWAALTVRYETVAPVMKILR